ncbi:MAG: hypothetical protein PUJ30_03810, partial [Bacteroidales bacterium]|nr:hypothetical protein [Bacteroidales bacterium]
MLAFAVFSQTRRKDKKNFSDKLYKSDRDFSNPQKLTCIIFENLFGPYFLPHQSHSYGYAPSSGENLTSKMSFKSDATYYFHI